MLMNRKQPYRTDEPKPVFVHEISINGRKVVKGMEISATAGVNRPAGRYRFEYAEVLRDGTVLLQTFGPTRRKVQRYRTMPPTAVHTVHIKTRPRGEEEEVA